MQTLRERLGNVLFCEVASYVPASFQFGLSKSEEDCIVKVFRLCIHEHHWLALHVDRPHANTKVSAYALVKAMEQRYDRRKALLDADGVYALSVLCYVIQSPTTQLNISEKEDGKVELLDSDSDAGVLDQDEPPDELPHTPLSYALASGDPTLVGSQC